MSTLRAPRERNTKTYTVEVNNGAYTLTTFLTIEETIDAIEALPMSTPYRLFTSNAGPDTECEWSPGLSESDRDALAEAGLEPTR